MRNVLRGRTLAFALLTSVIAVGGLAASVGTASASKKPVLNGTLSCVTTGTTTITPGIVLTSAQLTKGKDKAPKYVTNGGTQGCTGTTASGTQPTSYTLSSKAKGTSRLLVGAPCDTVGRVAKTKITFNTGDKLKANMTSELSNYAFNPTTHVSTQFPPCGGSAADANAFVAAHVNDRIESRSHGVSLGKAYPGRTIDTDSVTTVTLSQELSASLTTTGVTSLTGDPAFSTLTIH